MQSVVSDLQLGLVVVITRVKQQTGERRRKGEPD